MYKNYVTIQSMKNNRLRCLLKILNYFKQIEIMYKAVDYKVLIVESDVYIIYLSFTGTDKII